jgi:phospholipid/cholesterol/gamma-HCH transport system substrate-binding protein
MIRVAIKFGAFVVVCVGFTVYLAFTIGNLSFDDPFGRQRYELTASFDDVTGLLVDDNVKVAGVVVGKVTSIRPDAGRALVTFRVDDDAPPLPADSSAAIRWRNLIGQRYLYVLPGDDPVRVLQDGDRIEDTTSVIDLGELFNRLGPIVGAIDPAQVNTFLDAVTEALDGREDRLGDAIEDLAVLAQGLAGRDEAIGRLLDNLQVVAETVNRRDEQIATLLENLTVLSTTFADNTAILDGALVELTRLSVNLEGFLDANAAELESLLGNLAQVTGTVRGSLPELDATLANIEEASRAVFRAGRYGEFLNQTILCAAVGPPPPGEPCDAPIIKGLEDLPVPLGGVQATSGATAVRDLVARSIGGDR